MLEPVTMEIIDDAEDYVINTTFPKQPKNTLKHLIEYRIKLLLKDEVLMESGETQLVATSCKIERRSSDLCLLLKPSENLPFTFGSEGYIHGGYHGRIMIKLSNYCTEPRKILPGAVVGYVILSPCGLE